MAKIERLKQSGTIIFPATVAQAVKVDINTTLENKLNSIVTSTSSVSLSKDKNKSVGGVECEIYKFTTAAGTSYEICVPVDRSVSNVEVIGQKLNITYSDGTTSETDFSKILYTNSAGNGINISTGVVSIKLDNKSETFLTVSANGVKVDGITTKIQTIVTENNSKIKLLIDTKDTGLKAKISAASDEISGYNTRANTLSGQLTNGTTSISGKIVSVTSTKNGVNTTLSTANGKLATLADKSAVTSLSTLVTNLNKYVSGTLSGSINTATTNYNTLSTYEDTVQDKINTLSANIATAVTNYNSTNTKYTNANTANSTNVTNYSLIKADYDAIENAYDGTPGDTNANSSDGNDKVDLSGSLSTDISKLSSAKTSIITELTTEFNNIKLESLIFSELSSDNSTINSTTYSDDIWKV